LALDVENVLPAPTFCEGGQTGSGNKEDVT
jgi:hypothetical protein